MLHTAINSIPAQWMRKLFKYGDTEEIVHPVLCVLRVSVFT
jgi:hypothetical protein